MPGSGKLIAICQWGGKFTASGDGTLSYSGGDAHALSINKESKFEELKSELAEMWKLEEEAKAALTVKYFLPDNSKTLITLSSDKDIQRMIDFHEGFSTVDVFVVTNDPTSSTEPAPARCAATKATPRNKSGRSRVKVVDPVAPVQVTPIASIPPVASIPPDSSAPPDASIIPATSIPPTASIPPDASILPAAEQLASPLGIVPLNGDEEQLKLRRLWACSLSGLHQQFSNVEEVRDAIRKYSVAHGFTYKFKNNDGLRVSAKCKAEGCIWRIYVSRLSTTPLFRTKKFVGVHTCGVGSNGTAGRPHASRKLVASIMKEKLCGTPNSKPKEIAEQIQKEFGIELRYSQAWRGMETAKEELHGSYKESYNHLPWLHDKILETNPGSVVSLVTREDRTFHRLFVAFHSSISGFQNGCRPLIFLDAMTIKSRYQSELLTATALDGNDDIFPVAFAVVDNVDNDNWYWFLSQLKSAISPSQPITFVANRQLQQPVLLVFEDSCYAYCLSHLSEELKENLISSPNSITQEVYDAIVGHLYEAACAATPDGFKKGMDNIRNISPEAYEWLLLKEPELWANSVLKGSRCNHVESIIAAPFYNWVSDFPVLPVTQIVDTIFQKLMEMVYVRKADSDQWMTKFTPSMEEKLQREIIKAQSLQVMFSTSAPIEVRSFQGVPYFVYVDAWDCSCREWQLNGFPCCHAVAVLQHIGQDLYDNCSRYYTTEAFRLTYSQPIYPVPTCVNSLTVHSTRSAPGQVDPPPLCRLTGPPKKRRDRSKGKVKRPLRCSKCKGVGHNRATCHVYA